MWGNTVRQCGRCACLLYWKTLRMVVSFVSRTAEGEDTVTHSTKGAPYLMGDVVPEGTLDLFCMVN